MTESAFVRLLRRLFVPLLTVLLSACGDKTTEPTKSEGSVSSISGYNYTIEGIQEFYVNGAWGSNLGVGDGGGSDVCCITLPKKWTPGLSATMEWRRTDCGDGEITSEHPRCPIGGDCWPHKSLKATVPIEPYDRVYTTYVAFLPNDEVKIYVTPMGLRSSDHPAKLGVPRPLDHPEWKPYQP
jgi:hypothetical protein